MFQILSGWADGPEFVTQCPIRPRHSYTYRFNVTGQVGTLWWHAHVQWLRATVYGALLIRPRPGHSYPFPKPYREYPIVLGTNFNPQLFTLCFVTTEFMHSSFFFVQYFSLHLKLKV